MVGTLERASWSDDETASWARRDATCLELEG